MKTTRNATKCAERRYVNNVVERFLPLAQQQSNESQQRLDTASLPASTSDEIPSSAGCALPCSGCESK